MTGVAAGCMPISQGCGSAGRATGAHAITPIEASANPESALLTAIFADNRSNRAMRLQPLSPTDGPPTSRRASAAHGKAARNYTKPLESHNRAGSVLGQGLNANERFSVAE